MRRRIDRFARLSAPALALLLAACASGTEERPLVLQVIDTARTTAAARKATPAGVEVSFPEPTRAMLDTVSEPILEIRLERRVAFDFLPMIAERRDDSPGLVQVWQTSDAVTVTTRNGVVISTRGIGGDILSSSVQVSGDRPGPSTGGERFQMIRALDNREVQLSFACDLTDLGAETIDIIDRRHATRHLQERCEGGGGEIVNDYWIDSRRGQVVQSRQWVGPYIGYMRLRRLTN